MHRRLAQDGVSPQKALSRRPAQPAAGPARARTRGGSARARERPGGRSIPAGAEKGRGAGREELNLGHILIKVAENASPTRSPSARRAQQALDKLRSGSDFATLA